MTDLDKLAVEAEADRLSGVYLRIKLLAQAQRIDILDAGRDAVAKGIVSAADWELVRAAICESPSGIIWCSDIAFAP